MPYIGKNPVGGGFHKLDALTASATATYALTLNTAAYYPESANQLLVSLNGVIQAPQDSFTVSGSNIVFATALTAADSIDFVVALGDVLAVQTVTDGAITTAKLGNGAVTDAKIDTMAASKLTGALPALDGSALTGIAQPLDVYNVWYLNASKSLSSGYTQLTAASDWTEESAKIGSSMSFDDGTGKWTFPSTGIWEVTWHTTLSSTGNTNYLGGIMYTTTDDGSNFTHYASSYGNATTSQYTSTRSTLVFDVTDTSTHKIRLGVEMGGAGCTLEGGSIRRSYGIFKRLGNT